ncbi:unnamed protein product [Protopolystoma xenopodis]|uniref:Uncharacterized protein n=1 Tax=Protopolystoma xenopodis TaxID=117903 RepID=A0A3S5BML2_9PLAT|nr:unnamed protein product [Protopolystoma xenopodis]
MVELDINGAEVVLAGQPLGEDLDILEDNGEDSSSSQLDDYPGGGFGRNSRRRSGAAKTGFPSTRLSEVWVNISQWQGPPCGPMHSPCSQRPPAIICRPHEARAECACSTPLQISRIMQQLQNRMQETEEITQIEEEKEDKEMLLEGQEERGIRSESRTRQILRERIQQLAQEAERRACEDITQNLRYQKKISAPTQSDHGGDISAGDQLQHDVPSQALMNLGSANDGTIQTHRTKGLEEAVNSLTLPIANSAAVRPSEGDGTENAENPREPEYIPRQRPVEFKGNTVLSYLNQLTNA